MNFLQNIWIQIAMGFLPAAVVAIILLFTKRIWKMAYITLTVGITAVVICGGVTGVVQTMSEMNPASKTQVTVSTASREELEQVAYCFLLEGDTTHAASVLEAYSDAYGYDNTCSLIQARINVLEQDFAAARAIYRKLYGDALPAEAQATEKLVEASHTDLRLTESLIASGRETDLRFDPQEITELTYGGVQQLVFDAIGELDLDEDLKEGVEWVIRADALYDDYLRDGDYDEAALEALLEEREDREKNKILRKLAVFREARLKALLLSGDYEPIVSYLDSYTCCAEYMTVLELYLAGETDEDAISDALELEAVDGLDRVIRQLESVLEEGEGSLTSAQLLKLEDQIAMLQAYDDNRALYAIEDNLQDAAEDPANYKIASKIHMALSKLSSIREDNLRRNRYFSDALVTAPSSRDGEYARAMNDLSNVIAGVGGDALLKAIPDNAAMAVSNSYYIPGTGDLLDNEEAEAAQVEAVQDCTIKYSAAVTINSVDPSNFETVVLRVQLSDEMISEHELLNLVRLKDCNYDIEDYTIRKVEYKKSNIILCCDNSGSMQGSVGSLQNAVTKFLDSTNEKETIGFYTFDDDFLQQLPLGTATEEEIQEAVEQMGAFGGTSIFGSLTEILSSVSYEEDTSQVIILMTDGQDGYRASLEDIQSQIGDVAASKGFVVYVLGMGDGINSDYLTSIAQSGGGQAIYSPSDAQLESLYQFIHGALQNQYEITFKAKDTLTLQNRKVQVSLDQRDAQASKTYSIGEEDVTNTTVKFDAGVSVHGLSDRLVFREKDGVEVFVTGTGFKSSDHMVLSFMGERNYSITAEYVSENKFRVILPQEMAEGVYDMEVFLSGRRSLHLQELTVADGELERIDFGGYYFRAFKIRQTESGYELSGYVTMNDWLHFNGTVTLTGELDDASITLTENSGSYVDYTHSTATKGYAAELKNKGLAVEIPALGRLTLYHSVGYGEDYPTEAHVLPSLELLDLLLLDHPKLHLYPDQIALELTTGESKLPMQDFFMTMMNDSYSPFSLDLNCTGVIARNEVDICGKAALNYVDADTTVQALTIDFLDMRASVQKDVISYEFDTRNGFYKTGFNIKIPVLEAWVGVHWWFQNGGFDGLQLDYDDDFTIYPYSVPITFSGFKIVLDDFTKQTVTLSPSELYLGVFTGGFSVSAYKVSAMVPELETYVGDLSLLKVDAEVTTPLSKKFLYNLQAKATLSMLDLFELTEVQLKLGEFPYQDAMLGMEETDVNGFYFSIAKGLKMDIHQFYLNFNEGKKEFVITNRFAGVRFEGGVDMKLDWWGFDPELHIDGKLTTGFYKDDQDRLQFTVRASWTDGSKRRGVLFYVRDDGKIVGDANYDY